MEVDLVGEVLRVEAPHVVSDERQRDDERHEPPVVLLDHLGELGPRRRVEVVFQGERRVTRTEWGEHLALRPWRVMIYGREPDGSRRLIDRWAVQYAWRTERGDTRIETLSIVQRILQGYRAGVVRGGSEARLMGESWASEALQVGASEILLGGASEARP